MNTATPSLTVETERVDEIPVLMGFMDRLNLAGILDKHLPRHHLHKGLSSGQLACVWLAFIVSDGDHTKSNLLPWAANLIRTLAQLTKQPIRPQEFTDDRLGLLLRRLATVDWHALEYDLFRGTLEVYELVVDRVRLDASTFCGYHERQEDGIMQLGHSKDHRPDLPQLKLMAAACQHGQLLACDIHPGNRSDDQLYLPLIERVRKYLSKKGLLYVGDCKMAALQTRAAVAQAEDFYLCPLPLTGATAKEFPQWVEVAVTGKVSLQTLVRVNPKGRVESVGHGYEFSRTCQYPEKPETVDEETFEWKERVLLLYSRTLAQRQAQALEKRLVTATDELIRLTPEPGRGRKMIQEEKQLQERIQSILKHRRAENYLIVRWERIETKTRQRREYRNDKQRANRLN